MLSSSASVLTGLIVMQCHLYRTFISTQLLNTMGLCKCNIEKAWMSCNVCQMMPMLHVTGSDTYVPLMCYWQLCTGSEK